MNALLLALCFLCGFGWVGAGHMGACFWRPEDIITIRSYEYLFKKINLELSE